jgi:hypothetical protein
MKACEDNRAPDRDTISDSARSSWKQGRGFDRGCTSREEYAEQQNGRYKNLASGEHSSSVLRSDG